MNRLIYLCLFVFTSLSISAQTIYSLDSCRQMAIDNNKSLKIADEKIAAAGYSKKSAFANFLPSFDANATWLHNTKDIILISDKQIGDISHALNSAGNTLAPIIGSLDPSLLPLLGGLEEFPNKLKDAMTFDVSDMLVGMVSVKQPIFMGGKIHAYHEITKLAEQIAINSKETEVKDVLLNVDKAYWQVVSLVYKKNMAESYVALLDTLSQQVSDMYEVGFATKSDQLTVAVKHNEANIALTKVNDGLVLAKMLLAQVCGLPLDSQYDLYDAINQHIVENVPVDFDMDQVYIHRPEVRSLVLANEIYKKKEVIARSEMMPHVGLIGNYMISNPSVFDGFQKDFKGMFSFGVNVSIPLWNWGKDYYKVKSAKAESRAAILKLEEVRENIELQVNQAAFRMNESNKTLLMTMTNFDKAIENLENAQAGYAEGMLTTQNVLEAQTAWLKALSEKIDAEIDIRLSQVYLNKALGKKF